MGISIVVAWVLVAGQLGAEGHSASSPAAGVPARAADEKPLGLISCAQTSHAIAESPVPWKIKPGVRTAKTTAVTVVGRGVRVVGRIVPSVNIAAQFGSIDQTIVAMASAEMRNGLGNVPMPDRRARPAPLPVLMTCQAP